ncbi:MAG: hypothetical protein H6605_02225 [Flavobacteriales bacterium]|nr:hypothetical protein [Flavobacteriales bacterium]
MGSGLKTVLYDTNFQNSTFSIYKFKKKTHTLLDIKAYKSHVFFFFQKKLDLNTKTLKIVRINTDSLNKKPDEFDILTLAENRFARDLDFRLKLKKDRFEVWYSDAPGSEDKPCFLIHSVFDYSLKRLVKNEVQLPVEHRLASILNCTFPADSFLFINTKEYEIRKIEKRGFNSNYKFVFYRYHTYSDSLDKVIPEIRQVYADKGRMAIQDQLLCASGYFSSKFEGPKDGFWFLKYDFKNQILIIDTAYFFDKRIRSLPENGYNYSLLKRSPFEGMYMDYLLEHSNGNFVSVSEQYFLIPASFGSTHTFNRFYGDLLIVYTDKNGLLKKAYRIPKAQETYNNFGEFSSYYIAKNDSALTFIFNTHKKNKEHWKHKHLVRHKQSFLIYLRMDPKNLERRPLSGYDEMEGILQIRDAEEISPNRLLVYARKGRKARLGVLKLNFNL